MEDNAERGIEFWTMQETDTPPSSSPASSVHSQYCELLGVRQPCGAKAFEQPGGKLASACAKAEATDAAV